jgi:N utilization substance protein A
MQALSGGPSTPIEQVTELGDGIIQKLIAAGVTTVETLADMTPEQLEEIPGIGEKTLERISVAVRHYFGHFEEGEEGQEPETGEDEAPEMEAGYTPVLEEATEAVLDTDQAEAENDAAVITEAENVGDAEGGTEYRTGAETAVEEIPDEAEVETLEDRPAEALEQDAQSAEPPPPEKIETESATSKERSEKEDGA